MKDGDTVTLNEHMTESIEIDKALTLETNGKTFLYSSDKYKVKKNGTAYTFFKVKPATIEIETNGEVIETVSCHPGALPNIQRCGAESRRYARIPLLRCQ